MPAYEQPPASPVVVFCWLRKPPTMLVEVSRKKAFASSIERSELKIAIQQIPMRTIKRQMPVYGRRSI